MEIAVSLSKYGYNLVSKKELGDIYQYKTKHYIIEIFISENVIFIDLITNDKKINIVNRMIVENENELVYLATKNTYYQSFKS